MKRVLGIAMIAGLLTMASNCGSPDGPSGPGTLQVRLTSPVGNSGLDSAIVLTISGPAPVTSGTAGAGLRVFPGALGGNTARFALTGQLNNGATILTIGVADIGAQYTGSVQGVATGTYQLRPILSAYSLTVIR